MSTLDDLLWDLMVYKNFYLQLYRVLREQNRTDDLAMCNAIYETMKRNTEVIRKQHANEISNYSQKSNRGS